MDRLEENFGSQLAINNKNRDPGVNSEEEDDDEMRDDMFQFDRLSHCSSSLRSELSLSRLGTVSPAVSTPDLEAMRQPGKNQFEATKTANNNFDQEIAKKPSNLTNFEATQKASNSGFESVRRSNNAPDININNGWKRREDYGQIGNEDKRGNMKEDEREITVESMILDERPPSAETVAEDYSLPSYHQVVANQSCNLRITSDTCRQCLQA